MATLYPDVEAAVEPVKEDLPAQAPPSNSAGEPPLPVATRAQASGGASPGGMGGMGGMGGIPGGIGGFSSLIVNSSASLWCDGLLDGG